MAITKSPMIRYQILDNCFRHPVRRFFIEDLIHECTLRLMEINGPESKISRRQILEDISFMESSEGWSAPIKRNKIGRKVYFRYRDIKFSINNSPLNDLEILQFKAAIKVLSSINGMPPLLLTNTFEKLAPLSASRSEKQFVSIDYNEYLIGLNRFGELFNSIATRTVLEISYRPFGSDNNQQLVFHPYFLKGYNNRWFLMGRNSDNNREDWNLALDRIVDINPLPEIEYIDCTINWSEYYEDLIGVTRPDGALPEAIRLLVYGRTCHYIQTKPLHGSQKSRWLSSEKDRLEVDLFLIINFEFECLLLSYGPQIEVLTPQSLRLSIQNKLTKATELYS